MPTEKCTNKIIISPYSRKLRNNEKNPKDYPYWNKLIILLKENGFFITQVGVGDEIRLPADEFIFDLDLKKLEEEIEECFIWISVDNFLGHFGTYCGKKGIVLWGQSDPNIFGYEQNINILKDKKYLRKDQFGIWENAKFIEESFVSPEEVLEAIKGEYSKNKE